MPRRDFAQKAISRGGILVARAYTYIENEKYLQFLTVEIYSQTYAIKIKFSICLIRGRIESLGNDDVSVVHSR